MNQVHSCFQHPANFNQTGITCHQFDALWSCARFSNQPDERPDGKSSEEYCRMLLEDLINFINDEREHFFSPSSWICVDESISRWYGTGGDWINEGLQMYVATDHKPENGCKIWNACDGESGIMIRLNLVKMSGC